MFRLIDEEKAKCLKNIFLSTGLSSNIEIKKENINLMVTDVSENTTENEWGNDEFYLLNNNNNKPLKIKAQHQNVFLTNILK